MYKLTVAIFIGVICAISCEKTDPVVCTKWGCVRGKTFSGNQKAFEGFLGIPYAKKPINELRLKDPEPIEKWENILDATEEKPYCIQKNYMLPNPVVFGEEDCLYLYVYRPKKSAGRKLPVIVYLHGGGFFAGAAGPSITGSSYFMDTEEVIFVAMSYRLGPMGFLSTGDSNMPGNFGLKDQALAIKWVKENIEAFGGNSSNIALMGQSAGASSAHLHMMSNPKLSRNLFQSVVLLSGNGNGPYAYVIENPLNQAKQFAKAVGIENYSNLKTSELAEKLRNADPADLINACDEMKIWSIDPMTISRPVVEDCEINDGFLCENPVDLWRAGNYAKVPILTGFMDGDGGVRALSILEDKIQLNDLNKRFNELMPKLMEIENPSAEINEKYLNKIKSRYFDGHSKITDETSNGLIRLYTERSFVAPMINTARDSKAPTYLYKFSFKGPLSYSTFYTGRVKDYGSVHCDELVYLLDSPLLFPNMTQKFPTGSTPALFRTKFVKFITSFAVNGKPARINGRVLKRCESPLKSQKSSFKCSYVEFGENSLVKFNEIDSSIADFWNEIDPTMVRKPKPQQIEVIQIHKDVSSYQHFNSDS